MKGFCERAGITHNRYYPQQVGDLGHPRVGGIGCVVIPLVRWVEAQEGNTDPVDPILTPPLLPAKTIRKRQRAFGLSDRSVRSPRLQPRILGYFLPPSSLATQVVWT